MGVFANGPDPRADVVDLQGIAAVMRPVLYNWFSAHLQIINPDRSTPATTRFDPVANTGGKGADSPLLVLDSGADGALIQPIRSPSRVDVGGQPNGLLGIRFQIKAEPTATEKLRGGLLVKVLDGGNDASLTGFEFGLMEAIDSSLQWGRIYDAVLITGGT